MPPSRLLLRRCRPGPHRPDSEQRAEHRALRIRAGLVLRRGRVRLRVRQGRGRALSRALLHAALPGILAGRRGPGREPGVRRAPGGSAAHRHRAQLVRQDGGEQGAGPGGPDAAQSVDPALRADHLQGHAGRVRVGQREVGGGLLLRPQVRGVLRRVLPHRQQSERSTAGLAAGHDRLLDRGHRERHRAGPDSRRRAGLGAVRGRGRRAEHSGRLSALHDGAGRGHRPGVFAPSHARDHGRPGRPHGRSLRVHALPGLLPGRAAHGRGAGPALEPAASHDGRAGDPGGVRPAGPALRAPDGGEEAGPVHVRARTRPDDGPRRAAWPSTRRPPSGWWPCGMRSRAGCRGPSSAGGSPASASWTLSTPGPWSRRGSSGSPSSWGSSGPSSEAGSDPYAISPSPTTGAW